jgi:hypothetical protein
MLDKRGDNFMLAVIQVPVADARPFVSGKLRLGVPAWPFPNVHREFVRCFGPIKERRRGPGSYGTDEKYYCSAEHALRFPQLEKANIGQFEKVRCTFRRLLADGTATARIETGFSPWRERENFTGKELITIGKRLLELPTEVPRVAGSPLRRNFHEQVDALARLYCDASTSAHLFQENAQRHDLVMPGDPIILIEHDNQCGERVPELFSAVNTRGVNGALDLAFTWLLNRGQRVGLWLLNRSSGTQDEIRNVRLCLLRLHSQRQVLKAVLGAVRSNRIAYITRSDEGDRLEEFLNAGTRFIGKQWFAGVAQGVLRQALESYDKLVSADELADLQEYLQGARRQVLRKLELSKQDASQSIPTGTTVIGKNVMLVNGSVYGNLVVADRIQDSFNKGAQTSDKRINAWLNGGDDGALRILETGHEYLLNFKVGSMVPSSLVSGSTAIVPKTDIPAGGLETQWVVFSRGVMFAPISSNTTVDRKDGKGGATWEARFSLHIPDEGESAVAQLSMTPQIEDTSIEVLIYARSELYRQFTLCLNTTKGTPEKPEEPAEQAVKIGDEVVHSPGDQLALRSSHDWTKPPGILRIAVIGSGKAYVSGDAGSESVEHLVDWDAGASTVSGPIRNLRSSAERFRAEWEAYLNDLPEEDFVARLDQFRRTYENAPIKGGSYDWTQLCDCANTGHREQWGKAAVSRELQGMVADGYRLFEAIFPAQSPLRQWLANLQPGHRINFTLWSSTLGGGISNIPLGLMYMFEPPDDSKEVDPLGFFGLRFRIHYTAHKTVGHSKSLGSPKKTYRTNYLYWGGQPDDPTAQESDWQRKLWNTVSNQTFVPLNTEGEKLKEEVLRLLGEPSPQPAAILYLFCHCAVGTGNDPVLRFGSQAGAADLIKRTELSQKKLTDQPFVFANACTTSGADPYFANELEERFFARGCRAYLGTETKVPIKFGGRFATAFFHFFERRADPKPMPAGEALAQTRIFFWTHYRNIGGLFYTYINQYELFLADETELQELRM